MFTKLFDIIPASIFLALMFGVFLNALFLEKSGITVIKYFIYSFLFGLIVFFHGIMIPEVRIQEDVPFLPISWLISTIVVLVFFLWDKLRTPIYSGLFTINMFALAYGVSSLLNLWDSYSLGIISIQSIIFTYGIISIPFIYGLINTFLKRVISRNEQFFIVLINAVFMLIIWGFFLSSQLNGFESNTALMIIIYFSIGWNILFVTRQAILINMVLPSKHSTEDDLKNTLLEYDKNYTNKIQMDRIKFTLLIIFLFIICTLNDFFNFIPLTEFIWLIISLGVVTEYIKGSSRKTMMKRKFR